MSTYWSQFPNNFVYSGYFVDSSAGTRGSYGYYWSSSAYRANRAYYFSFYSTYVYPGTYNDTKNLAGSVRCLLDS